MTMCRSCIHDPYSVFGGAACMFCDYPKHIGEGRYEMVKTRFEWDGKTCCKCGKRPARAGTWCWPCVREDDKREQEKREAKDRAEYKRLKEKYE